MNMSLESYKERLQEAKSVSLLGLIAELGYKMTSTGSYWIMLSPFRSEGKGSFDIDKRKPNKWVDRGSGKHGDVIDFVQELFHYSQKEAIDFLLKDKQSKYNVSLPEYEAIKDTRKSIDILGINKITDPSLIDYIASRHISLEIAEKWLSQLTICFPRGKRPEQNHIVWGWKNDSGGYEMRNRWKKISNSPKNITTIKGQSPTIDKVLIFEGSPDFFSYLTFFTLERPMCNSIVLNTISFLSSILPMIEDKKVEYWGQNDKAGDRAWKIIKKNCALSCDKRFVFEGYKDFNEFLIQDSEKKLSKMLHL
jgi:hypothetical protein